MVFPLYRYHTIRTMTKAAMASYYHSTLVHAYLSSSIMVEYIVDIRGYE